MHQSILMAVDVIAMTATLPRPMGRLERLEVAHDVRHVLPPLVGKAGLLGGHTSGCLGPRGAGAVTDGTSVWAFGTESGKVQFDADTNIWASDAESAEHCDGRCYDIVMGKYDASNGDGLWATTIGGTGADSFDGAVMTADGPVLIGVSTSETIQFGGLTLNHLQHASPDIDEATWGPNRRGPRAMFSMLISPTDMLPSCISSCPTGEVSAADTTIASGQCYAYTECLANGNPSMSFPCFLCDAAATTRRR